MSNFKNQRIRSEKYRRYIASKPCLICEQESQAAHISVGNYGRGIKASDDKCVPLCPVHHAEMDAGQVKFINAHALEFGVDVLAEAKLLAQAVYADWVQGKQK